MPTLRNRFAALPPKTRRLLIILGLTTLGFLGFSLAVIQDLLNVRDFNDIIANSTPVVLAILGIIATWLAWKGKTRPAAYVMIIGLLVGLFLIPVFTTTASYATATQIVVVIIPTIIAINALSDREFTIIVVIALLIRAGIQLVEAFGPATRISGAITPTGVVAEWATGIIVTIFALYIAWNLNTYSFRVKMVLVLGLLTIIPTAIITSITSQNLESSLVSQANQNLVFSSDQLASAIDTFVQTNLDTTRTAALDPAFITYLGQPVISADRQGKLLPRGTDLEQVGNDTLLALLKRDPINIISCKILDGFATVQLSTNQADIGKYETVQDYYVNAFTGGTSYVSPVVISKNGGGTINFSSPIRSAAGIPIGVLDITYSASVLQQIIVRNSSQLGADVSAMLLDENSIILAHSGAPNLLYKIINPASDKAVKDLITAGRLQNITPKQLSLEMSGLNTGLKNLSNIAYFSGNFHPDSLQTTQSSLTPDQAGAAKLQSRGWYIVSFVPQGTLLAPVQKQTQNVSLISILISLISIGIALGLTQVLISPILSLTHTSERIAQGDINATARVTTQDEIGALASTFNSMTGRVRDLIGSLEQRVAERTQALERRAVQLQAASDVGSTAARLRNMDELLRQVTRLISQRFGFYHVGVFLLDGRGEYAVLRAANSEGGQRMLSRGHKLKAGQVGIVGNVASSGQARIALNVGDDASFFNNPDLPTTQSEMALPLIVGGRLLGVLDIQSSLESAFTQDDITTLKVLADQIAIALENARLFSENQSALETAQRAYGNLSSEGWQRLLRDRLKAVGYASMSEGQTLPVSENASPTFLNAIQSGQYVLENDETVLHLPVKIRGQSIGAIRMERATGTGRWSPEAIAMAEALSLQLGAALESARLYQDISLRAQRDATIAEISGRIGGSLRMESILRTTAEELSRVFTGTNILVQLKTANDDLEK